MDDLLQQRKQVLFLSITLYLIACVSPALILHIRYGLGAAGFRWGPYQSIAGWRLLYMGLFFGWIRGNVTAFANLPLWLSWIFLARGRYESAWTCSVIALVMSLQTFQLIFQPFLWNEGATSQGYLVAPHIGVLCWLGSMLVIASLSHRIVLEAKSAWIAESGIRPPDTPAPQTYPQA